MLLILVLALVESVLLLLLAEHRPRIRPVPLRIMVRLLERLLDGAAQQVRVVDGLQLLPLVLIRSDSGVPRSLLLTTEVEWSSR